MVTKNCNVCDKKFEVHPCRKYTAKFCSRKCHHQFMKGKHCSNSGQFSKKHTPWNKNKEWMEMKGNTYGFQKGHKTWNKGKPYLQIRGKNHPMWQGGKIKIRNYWFILMPEHPFVRKNNYILQSHLIAEKCLGRYLVRGEVIHHINGNSLDDRSKNLYLFLRKEHDKYHLSRNKSILKSNLNSS